MLLFSCQSNNEQMAANFGHQEAAESQFSRSPYADPEDSALVAKAKEGIAASVEYIFTEKDVILYNLGVGATEKDLQWTYENDDNFAALPTFGVIPQFQASLTMPLDWLPNYNPVSPFLDFSCRSVTCLSRDTGKIAPWRTIPFY